MGTITLPNNPGLIQNTQVTDATKVMENFTAIVTECNGSLDANNLAALAVETAKIANLAVTAAKLATDAVETLKIKDANVTLAKMAANSVDSDQYVDGSIDLIHMSAESVDSDQYVDGSIDLIHMSAESVDSDQYVDGSIDTAHLAADAVDDTKIGDAKIKKEHINADVVGTGLTGGVGTALSVDGIVEVGDSVELKCKVIEIGDWNMVGTSTVSVAHGMSNHKKIRAVTGILRDDDDAYYYVIPSSRDSNSDVYFYSSHTAGTQGIDATYIRMGRGPDGQYNDILFDSTSYNRGWITIWYEA